MRGLVIRTFRYASNEESTKEELEAFENGGRGKAYT